MLTVAKPRINYMYVHCSQSLYDLAYEYYLNDNFGFNKYYSSIAIDIDESYFNHIYNLTNKSYNHTTNMDNATHILYPHLTNKDTLDDSDAAESAVEFSSVTLDTNMFMNDSSKEDDNKQISVLGKRAQRKSLLRLRNQSNGSQSEIPTCTCHCTCDSTCFCGTVLCSEIHTNDLTDTLLEPSQPTEQIITENLQAALLKRYSEIILFFHVQRGHINFRHVIDDFRNGVFDDDPYLEGDQEYLERLKVVSHDVSPMSFLCVTCPQYKSKKKGRVTVSNRIPVAPFKKGYVDVIGPFPVGWGDARYVLIFRDEYSNYGLASALKTNSSEAYKGPITAWRLYARDLGFQMETLHFDAGSVGADADFRRYLDSLGVSQEYAAPGQQWANGPVERFIGTIAPNAKVLLKCSGLPIHFWPFAYLHAVFLHNLVSRKRFQDHEYSKQYRYTTPWTLVYSK